VIPPGFEGVEAQLWLWMIAMIRPGAAFLAAPVFGAQSVPVQLRLVVALAIGIPALDQVPFVLPEHGIASIAGGALVIGEVLAGLALGFAVQIGFAAAMLAGEVIGNAMGLGFAGMVDPNSGASMRRYRPVPLDPGHLPVPRDRRPSDAGDDRDRKLSRDSARRGLAWREEP
jgi:flagellar biosynthesis protein FliR